jgi:hypothetical protein
MVGWPTRARNAVLSSRPQQWWRKRIMVVRTGTDSSETLTGSSGADTLFGGGGNDMVGYAYSGGIDIDFTDRTSLGFIRAHGGRAEGDLLYSVEAVLGSGMADALRGNAAGNFFRGNDRADRL